MGLTELPLDFFQMFASETLDILRLKNNRLRSFNSRVFAPFHRVEYLDLSNNLISRVNISSRVHVEILALQDNALRDFPNLCLHHLSNSETANAFLKLRTLRIGGNQFETIAPRPLRGVCLPDLLKLDISFSTNLHTLQNNFIADLPAIEHLVANKLVRLNSYKPFAFNSSSLKRLNLQLNRLLHSDTVDVHHLFRHCPSLEHLNLAGTKVHLTETLLRQLLVPLTSLTTLNLEHVGAGFLPRDLLWRLPRLQKLYASGNRLNSTSLGGALRNVRSLVYLNVRGNQLQVVDASTVPWSVRQNLTYLDMSANPFACTCQLRWFTSWLEDIAANRNVTVHGYTNPGYQVHFRCHTPAERKWLPLRDFHLTDEDCTERSLALALGAAGGCVLAFVGVVIALAYRYRWYLRFFLYRCRRSRPRGDDEERAEMVHEFDIYVAHSPRELEWVSDQLVPLLEGQHGLRAFLLERDSAPGSVKADNIPVFLDRSARVLLLVSEAYLQEDWQMYEFQHIVYAVVDQQKDVIVVLRGNFHAGRMPRELTRMLTRGTFLQWGEGQEAQRVFREGLRVALETHDAACHNVC